MSFKIKRSTWSSDDIKLLGTDFDHIVGEWLGRTDTEVFNARKKLNIPGYDSPDKLSWNNENLKNAGNRF